MTPFAVVMFVVLGVAAVAGICIWTYQAVRRHSDTDHHPGPDAPFSAESASSYDRHRPGTGFGSGG